MYYVYLLRDLKKRLYIGYSSNLQKRLKDHYKKKVYTTKRMSKPKLMYYEAYDNKDSAIIREKKLKQFGSSYKGLIKRIGLS